MSIDTQMPEVEYHAHPALSSTGMKLLLDSPARFRWDMDHRVEKKAYDVGHAVHDRVLGVGMEVVAIPEEILASNGATSTAAAKAFITEARLKQQVPLKVAEVAEINAMAESVLAHPVARRVFEQPGAPEVSLFATDESGVDLRARVDYLPHHTPGRRTIMGDLKTTLDANPAEFVTSVRKFGYHVQQATYRHILNLARGDDDTAFLFVAVEKKAPYLVSVNEVDDDAARIGTELMRRAIGTYQECLATNEWPGYPAVIHHISLPGWYVHQHDEGLAS